MDAQLAKSKVRRTDNEGMPRLQQLLRAKTTRLKLFEEGAAGKFDNIPYLPLLLGAVGLYRMER
jgi:hypothetical protein